MKTAARRTAKAIPEPVQTCARADLPAIGADFAGGKFAGITLHGDELYALALLPGQTIATWKNAGAWAQQQGGALPTRHDALVLLKNLKGEFERAYYWTAEEVADGPACAWCQYFLWGDQGTWHKGGKLRARAVRRVPIR